MRETTCGQGVASGGGIVANATRIPMTTTDLSGLLLKAKAATPGPWTAEKQGGRGAWISGADGTWTALSCGEGDGEADRNASFIASANPQTVIGLIEDLLASKARADALEAEVGRLREALGPIRDLMPGWREVICELEDTGVNPVIKKAMLAALDQIDRTFPIARAALSGGGSQNEARGEVKGLKADFTRAMPSGVLDDTTFEAVESALDNADVPARDGSGKWLNLSERLAHLIRERQALKNGGVGLLDKVDTLTAERDALREGMENPTPEMLTAFEGEFLAQLSRRRKARFKADVLSKLESGEKAGLRAMLRALLASPSSGWRPFPPTPAPRDESIVEVKLRDGTERLAWFACNISEPGDWDFVPVEPGQDEPGDADSIGHLVIAWRDRPPAEET